MRVLVTGGAGYIGSHVVRALATSGHTPVIYDNLSRGHRNVADGFELIVADLADRKRLAHALQGIDAVMHFAAFAYVGESMRNPRIYFSNNVVSGLALLDAMIDAGVRQLVFSSTCAVYGAPDIVPITEAQTRAPINAYGFSKLFLEGALEAYEKAYGLESVWLRYFNAAGADESAAVGEWHDPETHLIPLALQAAAGIGPEVVVFGNDYSTPDGTCIRDYIHVTDLAAAHVQSLEYLTAGGRTLALNVGRGDGNSVRQVLGAVRRVTGRDVPHRFGPRRIGDAPVLIADPSRAHDVLGFRAGRSLDDCVRTAWNYLQKRGITRSV